MNKLFVTSSPHISGKDTTATLMRDVAIALTPALLGSVYFFGFRALVLVLISVASCVVFEALYCQLAKIEKTTSDWSSVVTGILIGFNISPIAPLWLPIVGGFFAIVIVKMLFGGLGKNVVNPALAARIFFFSWSESSLWAEPVLNPSAFLTSADAISGATPLAILKTGVLPEAIDRGAHMLDMFLGVKSGCLGETSAILLLLGGLYLLVRKVITWHIPVSFIGTVALLSVISPVAIPTGEYIFYNLFTGGLILGAFFMATDYATSPLTSKGRIIYGIGCGLLTVFIRRFGGYPEGVSFAIVIMNVLVWFIDKYTRPTRFGGKEVKA